MGSRYSCILQDEETIGLVTVQLNLQTVNEGSNTLFLCSYTNEAILGNDKIYASILFAANKRMFSMSQNLLTMLNITRKYKNQGWKFGGTVSEFDLKFFAMKKI